MTADQDAVDGVLAALADPTRRLVLDRIGALGETTASVLAGDLPVSRQAITQHLAVLERAGLVAGHRQGRERRYRVVPEGLAGTVRWLGRRAEMWRSRLERIKRIAEAAEGGSSQAGSSQSP